MNPRLSKLALFMFKIWLWIWVDLILHLEFGFFTWIWIVKQWLILIYFYFEVIWICISATTWVFGQHGRHSTVHFCHRSVQKCITPTDVELFHLSEWKMSQCCHSTWQWSHPAVPQALCWAPWGQYQKAEQISAHSQVWVSLHNPKPPFARLVLQ